MAFVCDMDGVVADFGVVFSKVMNGIRAEYPILKEHNEIKSWDWKEWYNGGVDNNPHLAEDLEYIWEKEIKVRPNIIWRNPEPLFPNAMENLNEYSLDEPIVFMTRRDGPRAWEETTDWLLKNGIDSPMVYVVGPGEEKGDVCKKLKMRTIIDDSPKNAVELLMKGINVIMPRWEYNKKFIKEFETKVDHLYIVSSLNEALVTAKIVNESNDRR